MDRESGKELFDSQTADFLTHWGQRLSRRGLLATVGKVALRLAGLSILPMLPVDRAFAAVGSCAGDYRLCGMCGQFCKNCCNQTASLFTCPTCTKPGASWTQCCCDTLCAGSCFMISYTDCCGTNPGTQGFTDSQAAACQDSAGCANGCPQPVWCGGVGGDVYRCTVIHVGATC